MKALTEIKYRMRDKLKEETGLGHVEFEIWAAFARPSSHGQAV